MKKAYEIFCYIILAVIIFLGICATLSSCSILKTKASNFKDTAAVKKVDSGRVVTANNETKNENKWFKESYYYNNDTTIQKNYYYTQPTVVIREGGTTTNHSSNQTKDSSWKNSFDSLAAIIKTSTKNKEEQSFSFWHLIGVAVVCIAVSVLLSKVKFSLKP